MQSATSTFDEQKPLVWKMGYGHFYDKEYLQANYAKFGKVTLPDVNYFSVPEDPLLDYIKDEFNMAKEKNKRVMITHLTSTSHHPYGIPDTDRPDQKYKELGKGVDDLSKWVNAIGYDDRWLGKILGALDDLGVANETLVVLVGDHGLSIPENGKLPTYYNPNTINNIVPMVFSHPLLPPIKVNSSVTSRDIAPTILDLLAETGSLSGPATKAAQDLTANYEGQSMIRPIRTKGKHDVSNWHFTVVNPGGEQLTVRDAHHKHWVVTVPVGDATDVEWQFSADDHGKEVAMDLEFKDFLRNVEHKFGLEAAHWAEEAAFIGRWWVQENWRRWRHGPYSRL
jgi:arylsulfatase A-like enzyme